MTRRFALGLAAIAGLALAVRLAYTLGVEPVVPEVGDASAYHLLAEDLADGRGYIRPFDLRLLGETRATAEYPPLFPAFLAAADLLGVDSVTGQRLLTCAVGAVGVVLTGLLGRAAASEAARAAESGQMTGLVAAGIAALHPQWFQADAILMSEALFVPLVAGVLLLGYRTLDRPTPWRMAALGAAIGAAALTRTEALLFLPLLAVPLALRARSLRLGAVAMVAALAVLVPWTVRSTIRFGELVPLSNNLGTALDGANCDRTYAGESLGLWVYDDGGECFDGFDLSERDEADAARLHRDEGLDHLRSNLGRVPTVAGARLLRTWGVFRPRQQAFVESLEGRVFRWQLLATRLHWGLAALAAVGAIVAKRGRRWPLLSSLVLVSLTTVAVYGNSRFRAAAEPALAVLAAVAVIEGLRRLRVRVSRPG